VIAEVTVVLGPARAGKTHELVGRYYDALTSAQADQLERNLWLSPSSRAASAVRDELITRGTTACLGPGVLTFDELAKQVVAASNLKTRPIAPVLERELLRRVIKAALLAGGLKFYAEAAGRAGFVDLLAEHLRELKRRDIRPEAYARIAATRGQSKQQQELARLYTDYEQLRATHCLTDEEGLHLAARDALHTGACPRFANLELVVVDGFNDFTRTQLEILRLLVARAQRLCISLPTDATPLPLRTGRLSDQSAPGTRADLFAKTAATLEDLKKYYPNLKAQHVAPRPATNPALDYLAQHVFRHPQPAPPSEVVESLEAIEIVEAAGTQDEILQLARRIKARLTSPPLPRREGPGEGSPSATKPSDIVVVFRSINEVAPRIEAVFNSFGIPYSLESNPRIARSAVFRTLTSLLQLNEDDWPFRRVVSIVTNNTLTALPDPARQAADWLVRDLQIATGREKLLAIVAGLAAQQANIDEFSDHHQRRVAAAATAIPAFTQLANAFDRLPQQATTNEWCAALATLGTDLGLPRDELDAAAWKAIVAHFAAIQRLDDWLGTTPQKLNRSELLSLLVEVATHEPLPRPYDDVGRVRILSAQSARAVPARHLYLAGMSEQSFPSPVRSSQLAADSEYRFLTAAAHQTDQPEEWDDASAPTRAQDEMLLFYEVLSRAQETLTISYPAMDSKAQELPPSPYVVELQRMFRDSEKKIPRAKPQLSPVPQSRYAEPRRTPDADTFECRSARGTYSITDWRIAALAEAAQTDGDRRLLAGLLSHAPTQQLAQAIDGGVRIIHARAHGEAFGPNEGLLTSPAVATRLAERFGRQHRWSPSQWETYAACPFKFFLHTVLKLEPLGDLVLETDFARRGSRLHQVLAAFHRQWPTVRGGRPTNAEEERVQFSKHLSQVIDQQIAISPDGGIDAALLELDRRKILKWADQHFDHHVKYDRSCDQRGVAMTPAHFEFRFGSSRRGDSEADPESSSEVFSLDISGEPIRVAGQIDRIDVGTVDGKTVFNVIDYKSGRRASLKSDQLATGQQLQLPIYVEAAQMLLFDGKAAPLAAGYWSMGGGFDEKGALASPPKDESAIPWDNTRSMVHDLIRKFVDDIRHGDFPVASRDDKCTSYCEFSLACRVGQARNSGKVWWADAPGDA
jgi:ATP-dependent helicase/nuclease subunit B